MTEKREPLVIVDYNGKLDFAWKLCVGTFRATFIFISQLIGILPYVFFMLLIRPITYVSDTLYWKIEGVVYKWLLMIGGSWPYSGGYTVAETGDDLTSAFYDRAVLMVNHQTTSDVPVLFYALQSHGKVMRKLMWVQDISFRIVPFGWVSIIHGDFFIQQGKDTRHLQSEYFAKHIRESYIPTGKNWLLLFPEGGFLYKRRKTSQAYAKKNGYPHLEHVTLPRIGALQTALQCLSPKGMHRDANGNSSFVSETQTQKPVKWVVDATIGYPENRALDLLNIMFGTRKPCTTTIHYRKFAVEDVPVETDALTQWLYSRYEEKEQMLDFFYKNGQFPFWDSDKNVVDTSRVSEAKPFLLSDAKVVAVYLIFFCTGCLLWNTFITPVFSLLWSAFNCLKLF